MFPPLSQADRVLFPRKSQQSGALMMEKLEDAARSWVLPSKGHPENRTARLSCCLFQYNVTLLRFSVCWPNQNIAT